MSEDPKQTKDLPKIEEDDGFASRSESEGILEKETNKTNQNISKRQSMDIQSTNLNKFKKISIK